MINIPIIYLVLINNIIRAYLDRIALVYLNNTLLLLE